MEKDILQNRKQVRFVKKISKNLLDSLLKMDSKKIDFLIEHPSLRKIGLKTFEKVSKQNTLTDKRFPVQVQMDKFYMLRAIVTSVNKALDKVAENPKLKKILLDSLIPNLIEIVKSRSERIESFKEKYGFNPPGFLTVSPGKFCNLKCTGCYANSTSSDSEKLDYDVLDRIVTEKTESWVSWFTVVSGGEPLCYKSQGKTIIDLAKEHQNNYFLMYTNGTLIDKKMANKLAEVGNITPCVFNPYSSNNINEMYKSGGSINDVLKTPFFKKIREWQGNYALNKKPNEMGNLILPCPIRDHYEDMVELLNDCHPNPIDEMARKNLKDKEYKEKLIKYDEGLAEILNPVWERQYLYKNENQTED